MRENLWNERVSKGGQLLRGGQLRATARLAMHCHVCDSDGNMDNDESGAGRG